MMMMMKMMMMMMMMMMTKYNSAALTNQIYLAVSASIDMLNTWEPRWWWWWRRWRWWWCRPYVLCNSVPPHLPELLDYAHPWMRMLSLMLGYGMIRWKYCEILKDVKWKHKYSKPLFRNFVPAIPFHSHTWSAFCFPTRDSYQSCHKGQPESVTQFALDRRTEPHKAFAHHLCAIILMTFRAKEMFYMSENSTSRHTCYYDEKHYHDDFTLHSGKSDSDKDVHYILFGRPCWAMIVII